MEHPHILRKKLLAVLKAAILGAALFDAMIVVYNLAYNIWGQGHSGAFVHDFFIGLGFLLAIPSGYVTSAIGLKGGLVNEYVVNGLLGAFLFVLISGFWQFVVKGDPQK